jgi:hypothetical protein
MSKSLIVVENYCHTAKADGTRNFVYRIFESLEVAMAYVDYDLDYLMKTFYLRDKVTYVEASQSLDEFGKYFFEELRPVKVFSDATDKIEYWTTKPDGSLDYLRNVIRLNVEIWDAEKVAGLPTNYLR